MSASVLSLESDEVTTLELMTEKKTPLYALGHSEEELRRLESQSNFFKDLTAQVFRSAGITNGMRVVDIGCGPGDVSFLAREFVGPEGLVIGVDKSPDAIATAQKRARALGLDNVKFMVGDVEDLVFAEPVDAFVGRLILMYFADPVGALRHMAQHLKSGGLIVFQEIDISGYKSIPQCLFANQAYYLISETLRRSGAEIQMGLKLFSTFLAAGLPAPRMIMGAKVEGGPDSYVYEYLTQIVRNLLPMTEKLGVASQDEVQIETLAQRMRDEAVASEGLVVVPPLIGAWSQKP
jgi:ubiquinone/menaquinone biosynthesis C-methylase UbiE